MNAWLIASATALTVVALGAVASERMRAHDLAACAVDSTAVAIGVTATATSGWLAWRGIAGIDTSIALGIAAVAAITDLQCGYVFDRVLLAGALGLVAAAALRGHLPVAVAGATTAAALLGIPWAMSRGRGIGLGDVKLAGVLGLGLGPYDAMRALWFAFVIGALVAVVCIIARTRSKRDALPFAPFLALGAILSTGSMAW